MKQPESEYIVISGSSFPELSQEIADCLGVELGKIELSLFPDGEKSVQILDSVRGKDVFVVQTMALNPDHYLMELLIIIDALKRASARSIIPVVPYYGYCRQDRKDKPRVPITAKLVADLLSTAGATRVLTMDLHAGQIQGFFDIPVDNLYALPQLVGAIEKLQMNNGVVVAPDIGSAKLARAYASYLGVDFAVVDKHRSSATEVESTSVIGDVEGKDVLLADDVCSTGGTMASAAIACQEKGANRIFAAVTHGLVVGKAVEKIEASPIEQLLMTNTIPITNRLEGLTCYKTVTVAPLFAQAIRCILNAESITSIYNDSTLMRMPNLA